MLFGNPKVSSGKDAKKRKLSLFERPEEDINLEAPGDLDMPQRVSPTLFEGPPNQAQNSLVEGESDGMPSYDNNYGLEEPEIKKETTLQKILGLIAGAGEGMSNGKGLFGGASEAASEIYDRENATHEQERERFYKDRDFRQKGDIYKTDDARQLQQLQLESMYKKHKSGIDDRNATANEIRANKPGTQTELEKAAAAQSRIDKAKASGQIPDDEDLALLELYDKKNQ